MAYISGFASVAGSDGTDGTGLQEHRCLSKVENYGLAQQMQRAAVSVPSNIAEGKGHHSNKEFVHFLLHARAVTLGATDTDSLVRAVNIYLEGTGNPVACDRGEREPRAKRINHLFVRKRVILPTTYDVRRTTIFYVFTP
jgi:hypothetical protein